jgi:hypothetical protein
MRTRSFPLWSLLAVCWLTVTAAVSAQGRWPTLEEQLARDRVPAGSALAKVIAANQQLELLDPREAHDKLGLPPWLRVLWRLQHPDLDYSGAVPGGYPLLLKETYDWMVRHPDLRPAVEAEADVPPVWMKGVSTGPDIPMGDPQTGPRAESDIRVNYWNPSQIVASSNNLGFSGRMSMYYSQDGGETWGQNLLPLTPGDRFQSDPAVEWTSDGTAWTVAIGIVTQPEMILTLRAWRSSDGGATWVEDGVVSGSQTSPDKQMLWTDHSARSPYKDNLYAVWHNGRPVYVNHRTGPDGAWGEPLRVSGMETTGTGIGSDIKTNALGHVFAFWPDTGSRRIYVAKSTNGGVSFAKPAVIANTFGLFNFDIPAQHERGALLYVTGGAFQNGKKSLAYAAWTDVTGAVGCRTPFDDPRENVDSPCKTRIWFSRSTNGGLRWTKPVMINNSPARNDQFNPWLVVDETTGSLGVIYYDTIGEERTHVNVFYQSSFDEGVHWSAPLRVSTVPSEFQEGLTNSFQFGDYNAFSGIAGTFFPSWTDRRDLLERIWTAKVTASKELTCRTSDPAELVVPACIP